MDKIEICDLVCYGHHGVMKEENVLGQKFLVSAVLYMDTRKAGSEDDLNATVNYADVAQFIHDGMKETRFQLIEAVSEYLAREILCRYPLIQKVEIRIKKPWAPIPIPLETVSVTIRREWTHVYIGVGANLGDKAKNIRDALQKIQQDHFCKNVRISKLYETEPYGYVEQDMFLNGVIYLETIYSPQELLDFLHQVESEGGRTREIHWGPRTIDLDILFYGDEIIQTRDLIIPHKEIPLREFVLQPMNEMAPYLLHPVTGKTISQMYEELLQND